APVLPKDPRSSAPARPVNTLERSNVMVEKGSCVSSSETRCQMPCICGSNVSRGVNAIGEPASIEPAQPRPRISLLTPRIDSGEPWIWVHCTTASIYQLDGPRWVQ